MLARNVRTLTRSIPPLPAVYARALSARTLTASASTSKAPKSTSSSTSASTSTKSTPKSQSNLEAKTMSVSLAYTAERGEELKANVDEILAEIKAVAPEGSSPRLVAISKIKPASDIQALYDAGHRHFGENYIQEMAEKAVVLPKDIAWHFVGSLQSNKAKLLASIPNLYVLETLSTTKLADILQKALAAADPTRTLRVYLQVNTSGEDAKSGLPPLSASSTAADALPALAAHVREKCPQLQVAGLMTIGSWEASHARGENPDFLRLKETRRELARILAVDEGALELSMGMSADFEEAVREGSSSVRVGTRIFGARPKKQKA